MIPKTEYFYLVSDLGCRFECLPVEDACSTGVKQLEAAIDVDDNEANDGIASTHLHDDMNSGLRLKHQRTDLMIEQQYRVYFSPNSDYSVNRSIDLLMYGLGLTGCFMGGMIGVGLYLGGVCLSSSLFTTAVGSSVLGLCGAAYGGISGSVLGEQLEKRNSSFRSKLMSVG